jgi:hypothetical protein
LRFALVASPFFAFVAAAANETVTYSYDALGRLTAQSTTGTVNNGNSTTVGYDQAGNRVCYSTTVAAATSNCQNVTGGGSTGGGSTGGGSSGGATLWSSGIISGTWSFCYITCSYYNGYLSGLMGSLTNTAYGSYTVSGVYNVGGSVIFYLSGSTIPPNSGWTSITVPGIGTLNRASATYATGTTYATWTWAAAGTVASGTVTVQ